MDTGRRSWYSAGAQWAGSSFKMCNREGPRRSGKSDRAMVSDCSMPRRARWWATATTGRVVKEINTDWGKSSF
jgi:hypothetical protein